MPFVYLIASKQKNGGIYVGQTVDTHGRWVKHKRLLRSNKHQNKHLQNSVNKYGLEDFEFLVAEECGIEILTHREQAWMDALRNGKCKIYNHVPASRPPIPEKGSKRWWTVTLSAEARASISKKMKGCKGPIGMKHTEEWKQKARERMLGNTYSKGSSRAQCWLNGKLKSKNLTSL